MNLIFLAFIILWLGREVKILSFYLYLWQLKEYHLGRFLEHWKTSQGKKLIWHPFKLAKVILFLSLLLPRQEAFNSLWLWAAFFLYGLESAALGRDILKGRLKKPVSTFKALFLFSVSFFLLLAGSLLTFVLSASFNAFFVSLLALDIASPFVFSGLVLALQPLTVWQRNRIIKQARLKRQRFKNLSVVGITGSYGKTSTKEFLKTILSGRFAVLATKEHQNSEIGLARCILNELNEKHEVFIAEMGAYDKGKIKEVSNMVQPQLGIITGVNEQHLALFGSLENLISAEGGGELIENLPENGLVIVNWNNLLLAQSVKRKTPSDKPKLKIIKCATAKEGVDVWAENIQVQKDRLYFRVMDRAGDAASFEVNLLGGQNIENLLLATAAAKELGMTLSEVSLSAAKIKPDQGPLKLLVRDKQQQADVIDSTYSANPNGVEAALEHLKLWSGKKVVVMPCLIELGPASSGIHYRLGQKIAQTCDLAIITTPDWFKEIKKGATEAGLKPQNLLFLEKTGEILAKVKPFCQAGNVILLEGRLTPELTKKIKKI